MQIFGKSKILAITITAFVFLMHVSGCGNQKKEQKISSGDALLFDQAISNGKLALEGFERCDDFVRGWLKHADPVTGLIPRNLGEDSTIWNAKDAAADNYPFMVLTTFFTDTAMYHGRMIDMLEMEKAVSSRDGALPDTYSFERRDFAFAEPDRSRIVFGASEYMKDGLLPLTEWLGESPWYDRMMAILHDLHDRMDVAGEFMGGGYGRAPQAEVNGELLQVLSRIYWMSGEQELLDWAVKIGDYYLLGDHHPTRNNEYLRLRDHGCELISGLCELYATVHFARPDKKSQYEAPLHEMLDRILEVGRNEHGMFYDAINPMTGEVVSSHLADTWGYTLNGYYLVYTIDGTQPYYDAIIAVFNNLNDHYQGWDWEGGSADGYADAIESALNLYNRINNYDAERWIDSEIKVMWEMQQPEGIIEGWHGDGNFARTTIMYNLWKTKGTYVHPWRSDVALGGVLRGDSLFLSISSQASWKGRIYFDRERHKVQMRLPMDWPRINQFPEWFTVDPGSSYSYITLQSGAKKELKGLDLVGGLEVELSRDNDQRLDIIVTCFER